jgi:hypothetical protein
MDKLLPATGGGVKLLPAIGGGVSTGGVGVGSGVVLAAKLPRFFRAK